MRAAAQCLAKTMENPHRLYRKIIAATEGLAVPTNYYRGRQRWPSELPDNVLLFMRDAARNLSPRRDADFHHRWVLLIALEGRGTVRIDRQPCELRPGRAILIPPLHLHDYTRMTEPAFRWLFVTFEWPGHTAHSTLWRGVRALNALADEALESLVRTWLMRPAGEGTLLAAQVMNLLMLLYGDKERKPPPAARAAVDAPAPRLIAAVQNRLKQVRNGPVRIDALAQHLGTSESHLRARFRREAGISLGRYLRETRVREAAMLLREQGVSVKAAAERMGFNDIYAFSRAFKHVVGVPPSQVRKAKPVMAP
jgi:AraC-like DNA-binding protein/mannose-6-phosphate isomerase-like protein (cupin superfamily)